MRYVKLEEICFKGVSSLRQKDTLPVGDYPVYGASGICGYLSGYQHNEPYVAVVKDGAGVGRVQLCSGKSSVLGTLQALLPKDEVSCEYLYEVVRSLELGAGFTGSTIPHIYFKDYKNRTVVIYEKEQQTKITTLFTTLKNVVELHKCAISFYDELVKSRFVEMFGTASDKRCVFLPTEEVCEVVVDCPHETPKYQGDLKYPAIRTSELVGTTICWDTMKYVSGDEYQKRTRRLKPRPGDVVYAREGTYGNAAVLPKGKSFCLGQRIMLFRVDSTVCLPEFFLYALTSTDVRKQADELNVGTTVPHVNVRDAKKFLIPIPPLSLQWKFADFVTQVDKLKFDFDFLVSFSIPSICLFCLKLDP